MRILIVGVCDKPESTNAFMANAFKDLGHTVDVFNYRTVLAQTGDIGRMNLELGKYLLNNEGVWQLVIFCKTDTVYPDVINLSKQLFTTFYFFMDPLQTAKGMGAHYLAKEAHFVSATTSEVIDFFKKNGSTNVSRIIEGVDTYLYQSKPEKKIYEVSFIGSRTDKRQNYIRKLREKGVNIEVFGNGWDKDIQANPAVYNEDLAKVIRQSYIVLNFIHGDSYSDRVTITLATGGFLLSEHAEELKKEYIIGEHLQTWKTFEELHDKIDHFLHNFVARLYVANAGNEIAKKYTWERTCKQILGAINGQNNTGDK
jgi:hypothetical protein